MGFQPYGQHDLKIGFLVYTSDPDLQQMIWHHVVRPRLKDYPHEQIIDVKMSFATLWIYGQKLNKLFRHICNQDLASVSIDTEADKDGVLIRDISVIDEED